MSKYITKADLKGYDFNEFEHAYLFDIVNRKDANGYNGRYFSAWYTDGHLTKEESNAVADMIWALTLTFFRKQGYEAGKMAQTKLNEVAEFIGEKMNIWSGEIIRWLKGMDFGNDYDLEVCDHWGLNTLTIFINK